MYVLMYVCAYALNVCLNLALLTHSTVVKPFAAGFCHTYTLSFYLFSSRFN